MAVSSSSRQKRTAAARDNVLCARILAGQKCKVVEEARTLPGDRRREPNHTPGCVVYRVDPTAGGPPFVVSSFWGERGVQYWCWSWSWYWIGALVLEVAEDGWPVSL